RRRLPVVSVCQVTGDGLIAVDRHDPRWYVTAYRRCPARPVARRPPDTMPAMHQDSAASAALDGPFGDVMSGFPAAPALQVNLSNWQQPPYLRWAFQHLREVIPTQPIRAGAPRALPVRGASAAGTGDVDGIAVALTDPFSSALSSEPMTVAG